VARQNEVQTLEEQIAFLKAVHEQEVSELSRLQTIVGFDPAQFYRTELERAIRDIRGDFEQLNHEQKRELEEWYRIKTEEVEKEVAKTLEHVRNATTGMSIEDSNQLKQTHLESQREFIELQRRHSELMARLREYEERLEHTKSDNQVALAERDREIALLREKISEIMASYDELMNRKTSLEFEINTYRRLLECEETRIKTGVSSASSAFVPQPQPGYTNYPSSSNNNNNNNNNPRSPVGATVINSTTGGGSGGSASPVNLNNSQNNNNNNNNNNVIGNLIKQSVVVDSSSANVAVSASSSIASTIAGAADPNAGGNRSSFTQRGSSTELSSETITKRMQVQRTSKGTFEQTFESSS
jgi:hypothetical protein